MNRGLFLLIVSRAGVLHAHGNWPQRVGPTRSSQEHENATGN